MTLLGFVLDWQKKLGYKTDPFVATPSKQTSAFFVDREKEREKLNLFVIKQHRFGIIHGPSGSGKSTLLGWLKEQLGAHFLKVKVVSYSEPVVSKENLFLDHLLHETLNLFERTVTKPHEKLKREELAAFLLGKLAKRRVVILVDDAQNLAKANKEILKNILEQCPGSQVLLVLERILKEHEEYGNDALSMTLKEMSEESLVTLIERRIALAGGIGIHPFQKSDVKALIDKAKKHPVKLLELARERVMELSLTAGPPPKPPKKEKAPKSSKEAPQATTKRVEPVTAQPAKGDKKEPSAKEPTKKEPVKPAPPAPKEKKRWFSIKFVKEEELDKPKQKAEMLDETILEPRGDSTIDADMLNELVSKSADSDVKQVVKEVKEEKTDNIEVEDVIQSLVEELDEEKR